MTKEERGFGRGGSGHSTSLVCVAAVLVVAGLSLAMTFVLPRPFYVLDNDYDNGHYYNIRAHYRGFPIHNVEHPGTPVIMLGSLLMTARTEPLNQTQKFLNQLYLVVGLVTCASVGAFSLLVLRRFPAGAAALSLSALAAWPAFLMGLNQYCTESFVLGVGLVTLGLFWRTLEGLPRPRMRSLALLGGACGLCLSVKMSFAPFVVAVFLASGLGLLRSDLRGRAKLTSFFVLALASAGGFAAATAPIFCRLDEVLFKTLHREDVRMPGSPVTAVAESFWVLLRESPGFAVLLAGFTVAAVFVGVRQSRRSRRCAQPRSDLAREFDHIAGLVFIVLLSGALFYAMACAAQDLGLYYSVGHSLRNASPAALVVPFSILYCARLSGDEWGEVKVLGWSWQGRTSLAIALVLVVAAISVHLAERQTVIRARLGEIAMTRTRLEELRQRYGRLVFWDGSPGWRMGGASFHHWGNYLYAESVFEDEVMAEYQGTAWFPLREIRRLRQQADRGALDASRTNDRAVPEASEEPRPLWRRPLHWVYRRWLEEKRRRPAFPRREHEWFTDEEQGGSIGLLAFPEREVEEEIYRPLGWTSSDLKAWLERRYGPLVLWRERIATADWVLLAPQSPGE